MVLYKRIITTSATNVYSILLKMSRTFATPFPANQPMDSMTINHKKVPIVSNRINCHRWILRTDKYMIVSTRVPYRNLINRSDKNGRWPVMRSSVRRNRWYFLFSVSHRFVFLNSDCPNKNHAVSANTVPKKESQNTVVRDHKPWPAKNAAVMITVSPKKNDPKKIAGNWYVSSNCVIKWSISCRVQWV